MSGRRSGKTHGAAQTLVVRALKKRGEYWWVGPTADQVEVAIETVRSLVDELPGILWRQVKKRFILPNGSRITFKSAEGGKSLRGWGLDGLVVDEAADIKRSVWIAALLPALMDKDGWVILCGTPKGFNWFAKWRQEPTTRDDPDWIFLSFPTWANPSPNTSRVACDKKRGAMGEQAWRQEHLGVPTSSEFAIWPASYFDNILVDEIPQHYQRAAVAVDLSEGNIDSDWQAITMLGFRDKTHYLHCENHRLSAPKLLERVKAICDQYTVIEKLIVDASASRLFVGDEFRRMWPNGGMPKLRLLKEYERKETRIQRLASLLDQKLVKVLKNKGGIEYVNEGLDFPDAEHDDVLDSHEMAWRGLIAA